MKSQLSYINNTHINNNTHNQISLLQNALNRTLLDSERSMKPVFSTHKAESPY